LEQLKNRYTGDSGVRPFSILEIEMQEITFLWEHFKIHADQRIKTFNFFVVLSIFADSGYITALAKESPDFTLIISSLFIILLSCIFGC